MLSDVGSKVIRAFGILNTNVPEDHQMMYGMPWPGEYLIAPDGTVRDKLFLPSYEHRPSASGSRIAPFRRCRRQLSRDQGRRAQRDGLTLDRPLLSRDRSWDWR